MIIAISGHTHAGKSTIANLFQQEIKKLYGHYTYPIRKFSEPLRDTLTVITGLRSWEHSKNQSLPELWQNDLVRTGRDMHKAVGEGLKTFLGSDVWAKSFFSRYTGNMIIDDLRFESELNHMQLLHSEYKIPKFYVVKVETSIENRASRGGVEIPYLAHLDRRDDVELITPDFTIKNDVEPDPGSIRIILNQIGLSRLY